MALHFTPRKPRSEQIHELEQEWKNNPRWKDVTRGYPASDVVNLRGSIPHRNLLAAHGADKLWSYLNNQDFINSLGAVTGGQAVQHWRQARLRRPRRGRQPSTRCGSGDVVSGAVETDRRGAVLFRRDNIHVRFRAECQRRAAAACSS